VPDVSGEVAIACFRIVQEALTNVVRHARAKHAWIELSQSDRLLELEVRDDGEGFDVPRTLERAASGGNLGLIGMRERVQILGGRLEINSQPGQGTRIRVQLPLRQPALVPEQQRA
jgi:two-component system, NarL family, sensor histidine kinase UhpB